MSSGRSNTAGCVSMPEAAISSTGNRKSSARKSNGEWSYGDPKGWSSLWEPDTRSRRRFEVLRGTGRNVNGNVGGGLEWYGPEATRRIRLLVNYYRGFNPYGQFFSQRIETIAVGLYFRFLGGCSLKPRREITSL